ncbi:MAG: DUF535 family protein [Telluria sp.]
MLLGYLARHWLASRKLYGPVSWAASVARSMRVLRWPGQHRQLCELDIFRKYICTSSDSDVFHHLSHRDYLSRHLTPRQRVSCVLSHFSYENATFDDHYKRAVYGGDGLTLWQHVQDERLYSIILKSSQRYLGEGDLHLALYSGEELLHRIGFSWVDGAIAGLDCAVAPFIARNQGRWRDAQTEALFEAFEDTFPHNSPAYFCAAAMQGLASFARASHLVCVKSELALAYKGTGGRCYAHAYDKFWDAFGGAQAAGECHVVQVPFQLKPLADIPSKHRKRSTTRRQRWQDISEAAQAVLRARQLAPAQQPVVMDEGPATAPAVVRPTMIES